MVTEANILRRISEITLMIGKRMLCRSAFIGSREVISQ